MTPLLEARSLTKRYGGRMVVDDLSFVLYPGEIVGLLGPNGAGKTTAFYLAVGLITPDQGEVYLFGKNVTKMAMYKRARLGIGYLAQEPTIFGQLTVEENILVALELISSSRKERFQRLDGLLAELHLEKLRTKKAATLSGGERRRLEISRALATNPRCLMLDEPFANVDPIVVSEVKGLIHSLRKRGIAILITDHNVREMFTITDRCYLLTDGKKLAEGSTQELLADPQVKQHYLGYEFKL